MNKPDPWARNPDEPPAVSYWKTQVRHWQSICAMVFFGGVIVGILAAAFMLRFLETVPCPTN